MSETSVESSRPLEIYKFSIGTTDWFYTSAEDEITVDTDLYIPAPIARGRITRRPDSSSHDVPIVIDGTNGFVTQYVNVVPGQRATVNITRLQRAESPTFATRMLLYRGIVVNVAFQGDGTQSQVATQSVESAGQQNMPRYTYMGGCNHIVYGTGCGVNPVGFSHTGVVTSVSGNTITVTGLGASGLDFTGGYCRPTGLYDFRLIVSQTGDDLELLLPFSTDPTSLSVQAFAGCNHLAAGDCQNVFGNVIEFGGFPWVPNRNIFSQGIDV